jgi:hypothetical protein
MKGAEEGDRMKFISRRMATAMAAVALALAALAGSAAGAGAASAATTPVVYAAHLDPWHGYVKPGRFIFGNGGAPELSNLTWKSWSSGSAWGTGKLWTQKPGCAPSYKCPFYSRWVGVYLNTVRAHGSARYYARMAIEFFVSGKARWQVGWYPRYSCSGCSAFWGSFPNAWPYF